MQICNKRNKNRIMKGGYVLVDMTNDKAYVGQGHVDKRLNKHKGAVNRKNNEQYVDRAIKAHGWENFKVYPFYNIPEDLLDYFEIEMIKAQNSLKPNGYNLDSGGNKNHHHHSETKKKISESLIGHAVTEETKKKLSELNTGDKHPMFGRTGDKSPMFGRTGEKAPMFGRMGEKHPNFGRTGEKHPMFGKKRPEHSKRMSGEKNPNFSITGEKHPASKLTDLQREAITIDERIYEEIAKDYGISKSTVRRIKNKHKNCGK